MILQRKQNTQSEENVDNDDVFVIRMTVNKGLSQHKDSDITIKKAQKWHIVYHQITAHKDVNTDIIHGRRCQVCLKITMGTVDAMIWLINFKYVRVFILINSFSKFLNFYSCSV